MQANKLRIGHLQHAILDRLLSCFDGTANLEEQWYPPFLDSRDKAVSALNRLITRGFVETSSVTLGDDGIRDVTEITVTEIGLQAYRNSVSSVLNRS